ncbi:MAG: hypothetical protein Q9211_006854 [Gyalolechia sp. 1 TL-2023]
MRLFNDIITWWGPSRFSFKGFASLSEIGKALVAAALVYLPALLAFAQGEIDHLVKPENAALASSLIAFALELLRRVNQGSVVIRPDDASTPPAQTVAVVPVSIKSEESPQ